MKTIRQTILDALINAKGDNLARAKMFWGGLTEEEMNRPHGDSGFTKHQIMDSYQQHEDEIDAAIHWITNHVD